MDGDWSVAECVKHTRHACLVIHHTSLMVAQAMRARRSGSVSQPVVFHVFKTMLLNAVCNFENKLSF